MEFRMFGKQLLSVLAAVALLVPLCMSGTATAAGAKINNADLMPKYVEDSKVKLDKFGTPEWVSSLIISNFRIELASDEGTFRGAVKALDHLQETGVNGVWISPIFEKGQFTYDKQVYSVSLPDGSSKTVYNGFVVKEVDKLDPAMGTMDDLKYFVKEAHKRNIRVFFDVVPHGVSTDSTLVAKHPEWFIKDANGKLVLTWGFSYDFDWNVKEAREYYINAMVDLITETNADGLRLDVEPQVSGNAGVVWKHVKERCLEKGKKIVLFPEHPANDRGGVYDFEQCGVKTKTELDVDAKNIFLSYNIVSEIKNGFANMSNNGEYKYYTYPMSVHDSVNYYVGGSELKAGYNMLFSPYIPIYYLGEEWNNASKQTLYFNYINYDSKSKNASKAEFYETFKQMVKIRRENADIFEYFADNHRNSNICAVETSGKLQAYARYAGNRGVLILPNNSEKFATINVTIPFKDMGLEGGKKYTLTNLMTGKVIGSGTREQLEKLTVKIGGDGLMVLAVDKEGGSTPTKPTTTPTKPTTTKPTSGSATGTTTQSGGSTSTTESVSGGSTSTSESTQISDVTGSTQESTGTTGSTNVTDADITTTQPSQDVSGGDDNSTGNWWIWVVVAAVVAGGVVVVLLVLKRRK